MSLIVLQGQWTTLLNTTLLHSWLWLPVYNAVVCEEVKWLPVCLNNATPLSLGYRVVPSKIWHNLQLLQRSCWLDDSVALGCTRQLTDVNFSTLWGIQQCWEATFTSPQTISFINKVWNNIFPACDYLPRKKDSTITSLSGHEPVFCRSPIDFPSPQCKHVIVADSSSANTCSLTGYPTWLTAVVWAQAPIYGSECHTNMPQYPGCRHSVSLWNMWSFFVP